MSKQPMNPLTKLQSVRGTKDIVPDENILFQHIIQASRSIGQCYGFGEISTPIFEFTEVYKRTLGESSDVVNKEMYTFEDRGGESITLRPEFTAGVVRAFIANGLQQHLPLKLFSSGPLFRYERPQKGRQRQFHQVNFESLGVADPYADVEVISLARQLLKKLGILPNVSLKINTLGCSITRKNYHCSLVNYLAKYKDDLSEDSQKRLEKNPLRILDSKDKNDREIIVGAPKITDCLTNEAQSFFDEVVDGVKDVFGDDADKINVDPYLVRGLDYYNHTVFEFVSTSDDLGAQNTVLAGGRYDGLVEQMGGQNTPAVGFAAGIERLMLMADVNPSKPRPVAFLPMEDKFNRQTSQIVQKLRESGYYAEIIRTGNFGKRLKKADRMGASHAVLFASDEMSANNVVVKTLDSGDQKTVPLDKIVEYLATELEGKRIL